eukprot:scaffold363203_cov21-Prasinocladus_malaysianus.AAC.1
MAAMYHLCAAWTSSVAFIIISESAIYWTINNDCAHGMTDGTNRTPAVRAAPALCEYIIIAQTLPLHYT